VDVESTPDGASPSSHWAAAVHVHVAQQSRHRKCRNRETVFPLFELQNVATRHTRTPRADSRRDWDCPGAKQSSDSPAPGYRAMMGAAKRFRPARPAARDPEQAVRHRSIRPAEDVEVAPGPSQQRRNVRGVARRLGIPRTACQEVWPILTSPLTTPLVEGVPWAAVERHRRNGGLKQGAEDGSITEAAWP